MMDLINKIFETDPAGFPENALAVFRFQYQQNNIYRAYIDTLGIDAGTIRYIEQIPFLPVSFFKTQNVITSKATPDLIFESSGTSATGNSRHLIKDGSVYKQSFNQCFRQFFGPVGDWCILGLLPSYLERKSSSLVYMVESLITDSRHPSSGFYLYDHEGLYRQLVQLESSGQKTLLIGVSFALLDFAEKYSMKLSHTKVMETGGMKGKREEITRMALHEKLKSQLGLDTVYSEYGMTELLSQAYSLNYGQFDKIPGWMKVLVRMEDDPLEVKISGEGLINIIDLANIYSCSFIATDDIGRLKTDGSFEIMGRLDHADVRGCNLLIA